MIAAHRREPMAISIVNLGEFAEGFRDAQQLQEFVRHFQVVALSRAIAWHSAMMQTSLPQRLGENDAWIAATARFYDATLVARDAGFSRVPRLRYLQF